MVKDEPKRKTHYPSTGDGAKGTQVPAGRDHTTPTSDRVVRQNLAAPSLQDRLLCHRVDCRQHRLLRVAQDDRPQGSGDIPQAIRGAEAHAGGARVAQDQPLILGRLRWLHPLVELHPVTDPLIVQLLRGLVHHQLQACGLVLGSGDIPQAIRGAEAHAGGARVAQTSRSSLGGSVGSTLL